MDGNELAVTLLKNALLKLHDQLENRHAEDKDIAPTAGKIVSVVNTLRRLGALADEDTELTIDDIMTRLSND